MNQAKPLLLLRASLIITVLLTTAALFQFAHRAYQADVLFVSRRFTAVAVLWGLAIVLETLLLVATWTRLGEKLIGALDHAINFILRLGKANILFLIILLVAFAYFSGHPTLSPELRLLVITGFLGGLTTFSTFSVEVVTAAQRGDLTSAAAIVFLHLLGSLACTVLGIATFNWARAA